MNVVYREIAGSVTVTVHVLGRMSSETMLAQMKRPVSSDCMCWGG